MGGADSGARQRVLSAVGNGAAALNVAAFIAGLLYAYPRLEELKPQSSRLDGKTAADVTSAAADAAVDFARRAQRAPRTRTEGPRFAFASPPPRGVAGEPGHWCAADVIGYRIDFDAALLAGSTRAREKYRWRRAAAEWTRASGGRYRLEYRGPARYPVVDGAAGHSPVDLSRVPAGEIALTYAVGSDRTGPGFRRYTHAALATALGVGGVEQVTWDSATPGLIQRGMVVLDAVDTANDPLDVPTPYVHELGHALGLGHVADRRQIMATGAGPQAQIGGGDIAGITRLASAGC